MIGSQKIPEGFSTLTPTLVLSDAAQAIELYKKAFGAKEAYRMDAPNGKIMHACLEVGTSKLFLCDMQPEMDCMGETTSNFYVYMEDVDSAFRKATQSGMAAVNQVEDMFWGDRIGHVKDRYGNNWTLATHVRDVSAEEMEEAQKKFTAKAA